MSMPAGCMTGSAEGPPASLSLTLAFPFSAAVARRLSAIADVSPLSAGVVFVLSSVVEAVGVWQFRQRPVCSHEDAAVDELLVGEEIVPKISYDQYVVEGDVDLVVEYFENDNAACACCKLLIVCNTDDGGFRNGSCVGDEALGAHHLLPAAAVEVPVLLVFVGDKLPVLCEWVVVASEVDFLFWRRRRDISEMPPIGASSAAVVAHDMTNGVVVVRRWP
ncbi:unnamed protein product [Closterium sp. NIES-53]